MTMSNLAEITITDSELQTALLAGLVVLVIVLIFYFARRTF